MRQQINIGAAADDGTGDNLRTGGQKINQNFIELYAANDSLSLVIASLESGKVDKVEGKGLSENDFTDALYDKLQTMEGSRWQGVYTSLETLTVAKPVGQPGWYAWVDAGPNQPVQMAIWDIDDQQWRIGQGSAGQLTPAQVLEYLLENPDVNVLTDAEYQKLVDMAVITEAEKTKLGTVEQGAQKNPDAVSQAEAQAGTVTELRSWSVLRVWQAIQAWWNASAMKTKLDSFPSMPPADGKTYALKDGQWVETASGGGAGGNLFDVQFYQGLRANLPTERPGFAFLDGQKALRSVWPGAFARITNYPIATEAAWAAGDKGKFTLGDGSTDFRLADWNGATGGKPRVLRGGVAGTEGTFEEDAMQDHRHGGGANTPANSGTNGNGTYTGRTVNVVTGQAAAVTYPGVTTSPLSDGGFDARVSNETRAASVKGAWIVRLSNAAGPVGQVDVQALASEQTIQREQIANLQPITMSGQIGTFHTGIAIGAPGYLGFNDFWVNMGGIVFEGTTALRRFIVPKAGVYRITANFVSGSANSRIVLGKNPSLASPPSQAPGNIGQTFAPSSSVVMPINSVVQLNAGDSVGFYLAGGSIQNTTTDTWGVFSIERISS